MFWLSMMPGHGTTPVFLNKKKDWTSGTLANPHHLRPITYNVCLNPPDPPQSGRHICITPYYFSAFCKGQGIVSRFCF